jgi:hypothetical protein
MLSAYMGDPYYAGSSMGDETYAPTCADFEAFVSHIVRSAGVRPSVEVLSSTPEGAGSVHVKVGRCDERRVAFVFFGDGCETVRVRFPAGVFRGRARDMVNAKTIHLTLTSGGEECDLARPEWGFMVLVQEL